MGRPIKTRARNYNKAKHVPVREQGVTARVLETALDYVSNDRGRSHGDAKANFHHIASLWSAYVGVPISSLDVCQMMTLLKISRSKIGSSTHMDHYVDQCGYSALAAEIASGDVVPDNQGE